MLLAAKQVAILYIIVAVGVFTDKIHLYTEKTAKACTGLLFYVITPAVIVTSFLEIEYDPTRTKKLFIAIGCGLLMHLIASLLSIPCFNKGDKNKNSVFKYAAVHGNCGYMSLPLVNAMFGAEGVFYLSAAIITSFQICSFTYGVYLMSGDKNSGKGKTEFDFKKIILNPGVLSVLVGLPLYLLRVPTPEIITKPLGFIAGMNTPLAMLMFGTYIANTNFKTILSEKKILGVGFLKLIILPAIMLGVCKLMGLSGVLASTLILASSAPSANNTVMFAAQYDKDTGLAAQTVAAVSFASIVTMPAMTAIAMGI